MAHTNNRRVVAPPTGTHADVVLCDSLSLLLLLLQVPVRKRSEGEDQRRNDREPMIPRMCSAEGLPGVESRPSNVQLTSKVAAGSPGLVDGLPETRRAGISP